VTPQDCSIGFGATGGTAMLRTWQRDLLGNAMFAYGRGDLDVTLGGTGTRTQSFAAVGVDSYRDAVLLDDGSTIAVGQRGASTGYDFLIAKHTPTGVLDTSFGCATPPCSGSHTFDVSTHFSDIDGFLAVGLQSDGRIIAAGLTRMNATSVDWFVARYTTAGVLDTTFGCASPPCSGWARWDWGTTQGDYVQSMVVCRWELPGTVLQMFACCPTASCSSSASARLPASSIRS
jgi:uncharacterized delta-60 repeat protein